MSKHLNNPWLARFNGLDTREALRAAVTILGEKITLHAGMAGYEVVSLVEQQLGGFYLPTEFDLDTIFEVLNQSKAHCAQAYKDKQAYMRLCFESHEKFETEFSKPICLTGPPGVGKSALVKAIQRLYKPEQCIDIGEGYGKFPLVGTWTITVKNISTINAALRQKLPIGLVMGKRASTHDLTYKCIEVAYRHGVALLMLDELQTALNTGQKANLIPDTVMALGHLGLPFMYVANYNLCHRLNEKMPRHVRHRILSWPFVMLPSPPDSTDWLQYLREIARILGSSLAVDLEDKRHLIFQYTGGIKRFVVQLFTRAYAVAFSQGRLVVNMRDIETYFDSTANSPNRTEIETALSAFAGKHTRSKEYDCPFELPKITAAAYVEVQKRSQAEAINRKRSINLSVSASGS